MKENAKEKGADLSREDRILKYIDRTQLGIEIAPYFNPLLTKADGNNILTVDIFSYDELRQRATDDPNIPMEKVNNIETVDIVGDASSLGDYAEDRGFAGTVGYIVSSHNFEHLPNPIKFLQGCSRTLKYGGVLSMAVPDYRACFDHFRSPTRLVDWLNAFHRNVQKPDPVAIFDNESNSAAYMVSGQRSIGCNIATGKASNFILLGNLRDSYNKFLERSNNDYEYKDAHCTVMFPESLELLFRDCFHLGLIDLEVVEISKTRGLEFFVHLRKVAPDSIARDDIHHELRQDLMRRVNLNIGSAPYLSRRHSVYVWMAQLNLETRMKKFLVAGIGRERYEVIRKKFKEMKNRRRSK